MPLRGDRLLRYVVAFCPACHTAHPDRPLADVARLSGRLVDRDGRVWLERGCPAHGLVSTLYDESPEILAYLEQWTAPTKRHTPDSPGNYEAVPAAYLRGLGEMQTQHTCILLADIAETCNLRCPTCFADSSPDLPGLVPVADVLAAVDIRLTRENGRLDVLMLSGGEPTLHPELPRLLRELVVRPIVRILINSNGVRIARDDALLDLLTEHRSKVEVYLQYDGSSAESSKHHRGADLRRIKADALARLSQREIFTTLTMTAALGVNDGEIGDVVRVALATPYVGGVTIQPQFGSGRSAAIDPTDRLTHTGVLARLGPQTDGLVSWRDLTALPCSHPHCCSVGYLIRDDAGAWRSLVALIGHDRLRAHLGLVANRIADDAVPRELTTAVRESLLGLLSEQSSLSHPSIGDLWRAVCDGCDLGIGTLLAAARPGRRRALRRLLGERVVRITVKPFMDMSTMLEERLLQCCVHVATRGEEARDQCAPFCAVQAWPALGAGRLPVRHPHTPVKVIRIPARRSAGRRATRRPALGQLLLASVDFTEIEDLQRAGDWVRVGELLAAQARSLQAGAAAAVDIPLLHIGDATAAAVRAAGVERIGLLGTRFTMEQPFLRDRLATHGLDVLVPGRADRELVHSVIYDEDLRRAVPRRGPLRVPGGVPGRDRAAGRRRSGRDRAGLHRDRAADRPGGQPRAGVPDHPPARRGGRGALAHATVPRSTTHRVCWPVTAAMWSKSQS